SRAKASAVPTRASTKASVARASAAPTRRSTRASAARASAAPTRKATRAEPGMSHRPTLPATAAGLGLRRALLGALQAAAPGDFDFLECAPENWIGVGGRFGAALDELSGRHPLVCHGLSLSLGGVDPLDRTFLLRLRRFLDRHRVPVYSEHLSYCTDDG